MNKRVTNIFNAIEKPLDAIIVQNASYPNVDDNFFYITRIEHGLFERSLAVLYPDGTIDLIIPELEAESAKHADVNLHIYQNKEERDIIIKKVFSSSTKVGIHFAGILYQDFCSLQKITPNATFVDVSDALTQIRLVKDESEIICIKKACSIADSVMEQIPDLLNEGIHEFEIAAEINYLMQKKGAEKPAFDTISSFGKNSAEPHYTHGNTQLKNGDFALFDFGACFQKYNSDITRTFVFSKSDAQQKKMFDIVAEAQKIGFDSIRSGVQASEVHNVVSEFIDKTEFKGRFIHSTGHSLGLAVHDGPGFSVDSTLQLKENMVFTVEPGIYIPDFGGVRIEDDILVKKDGIEILTKSSREFREI